MLRTGGFGLVWLLGAGGALLANGVEAQGPTGPPGKPWSGGQLQPGESRMPRSIAATNSFTGVETGPLRSIPEAGRVHIGTHEFYRDSNGVRKIDKTLSNYIQGICSDFRSKTKESCDRRNGRGSWFPCPEGYPHADSKVRNDKSGIPLCYKDRRFALAGSGPPGTWCVPSHLIGFGPEIAMEIQKGNGKVCNNRYRAVAIKDSHTEKKWKRRAKETGKELEKVETKELSYQMRNAMNRKRKRKLERELRDERAKERQWKVCVCICVANVLLMCC